MRIRHLTAAENVAADGTLIDPLAVRHGLVVGGRIADLAGLIDPQTHLNRDFIAHRLDDCLVAEVLQIGAAVLRDDERFVMAHAAASAYQARGPVAQAAARSAWRARLGSREAGDV
jgi:hypothetical protein